MFSLVYLGVSFLLNMTLRSHALPIAPRDDTKYVFAHHMVGNTYPYTVDSWKTDINLAHEAGIDAFALNMGSDSWQIERVKDAYSAADASGTGFKMFLSLDMSILPCGDAAAAQALRTLITTVSGLPAQFKYNGQSVVSTFDGDSSGKCTFGTGSVADGWTSVLQGLNVYFIPAFFSDPSVLASTYSNVAQGFFNWNSGWPTTLTPSAGPVPNAVTDLLSSALQALIGALTIDNTWMNALKGKTYMAAVSPTFFTHYGADSYNKNWIYVSDEHLYSKRWESLISARNQIDMVEVISFNDFGESHYAFATNKDAAQPKSEAWVDGFDHQGYSTLTKYYAAAFKTGSYPAITKDEVVMFARPHSKDATATNDSVGRPTNYQMTSDTLWAVAMMSAPGTVTLSTSPTNSKTFWLPAGANKISIPLLAGGPLHAVVSRNGQNTVDLQSSNYTFQPDTAETYNFNYYVISSEFSS